MSPKKSDGVIDFQPPPPSLHRPQRLSGKRVRRRRVLPKPCYVPSGLAKGRGGADTDGVKSMMFTSPRFHSLLHCFSPSPQTLGTNLSATILSGTDTLHKPLSLLSDKVTSVVPGEGHETKSRTDNGECFMPMTE